MPLEGLRGPNSGFDQERRYSAVNKRGRKPIDINWSHFETLCGMQCTLKQIANFLECSPDTIQRAVKIRYGQSVSELFAQKRPKMLVSTHPRNLGKGLARNGRLLALLYLKYLRNSPPPEEPEASTPSREEFDLSRLNDDLVEQLEQIQECAIAPGPLPALTRAQRKVP